MEVSGQIHSPTTLPLFPLKPLFRRRNMSQSRSHRYGEENSLLSLLGIEARLLGCMQLSLLNYVQEVSV
jgi:hypothetical protein